MAFNVGDWATCVRDKKKDIKSFCLSYEDSWGKNVWWLRIKMPTD